MTTNVKIKCTVGNWEYNKDGGREEMATGEDRKNSRLWEPRTSLLTPKASSLCLECLLNNMIYECILSPPTDQGRCSQARPFSPNSALGDSFSASTIPLCFSFYLTCSRLSPSLCLPPVYRTTSYWIIVSNGAQKSCIYRNGDNSSVLLVSFRCVTSFNFHNYILKPSLHDPCVMRKMELRK